MTQTLEHFALVPQLWQPRAEGLQEAEVRDSGVCWGKWQAPAIFQLQTSPLSVSSNQPSRYSCPSGPSGISVHSPAPQPKPEDQMVQICKEPTHIFPQTSDHL